MSRFLQAKCIDINSPNCPCLLASTNHCVFCSQLQGQEICDCNWSGVCILYEKKWNARNDVLHGNTEATQPRPEIKSRILERVFITDTVCRIVLEVPSSLADQLGEPGAFVFLRRSIDPLYFHIPIGVMQVIDTDKIIVVVEAVGPKSTLLINEDQALMLRGPYKNGIFGSPWIDRLSYGNVLLVAGGMGQPPAIPVAEKLARNYNSVTAIVSPGPVGYIGLEEMRSMGVDIVQVESLRRVGYQHFSAMLLERNWDLVVSCGPDLQHFSVMDAMHKAGFDLPMAATNNNTMCCGEGICGSCDKKTIHHKHIRSCKVQIDFADLKRD
jgi:dihydroorotate dehydrogenase electron transfer subunit